MKPIDSPWPVPRTTTIDLRAWLKRATQRLAASSDSAGLDAQVLLAAVLEQPRAWIAAHAEASLTQPQLEQLETLLEKRARGEPLPYLLGHWEFYGRDFVVAPQVLIPRPETELLVEQAHDWLRRFPTRRLAADVGTGSAAIAISLAGGIPGLRVTAVDLSFPALQVAQTNVRRHACTGQVDLVQGNLLTALAGPFDLVCANLPYIPGPLLSQLEVARFEPRLALDGGPDGLVWVRLLLEDAPRWLASQGLMLLEIESNQGETALAAGKQFFPTADVTVIADYSQRPRLLKIQS
jgi:release factor glutamine methyltransferase